MSYDEESLYYPFGEDGPGLTFTQVLSTTAMLLSFSEDHPGAEEIPWHMCKNGCCVQIHEPGKDEHVWVVIRNGDIEKVDRYGNSIEYYPIAALETELGLDMSEPFEED